MLGVCGIFLGVGLQTSEASTIRISSPKIELEVEPGLTYSGEIGVENPEEGEVKMHSYAEDWAYAPGGTGEKKFSPAGTLPLSCSNWITFTPAENVLPSFGKSVMRYTIKVPEDVKGGYYSVVFFETILGNTVDEDGVNVLVAGRIGALFFLRVKGAMERSGELISVKVDSPEGNKPMHIESTFHNTGNVDIALGGSLLIMDAQGKVLGRGDLAKIYTFPGSTETRVTDWVGRLPKGKHDLLLTYDLGEGKTLVKDETISVV